MRMMNTLWTDLIAARCRPADIPPVKQKGLYALFMRDPGALAGLVVGTDGLLYVGKAGCLRERNHFRMKNSARAFSP